MFGSLFQKKDREQKNISSVATELYGQALTSTRREAFYAQYNVPDTFDGRFDLLLVHLFIILHPMIGKSEYDDLSQAIFDVTFKDMDQTLREAGIGDMGIPKHMKRMMKAFNGRMHSYQMAIAPQTLKDIEIEGLQEGTLEEALRRNLFGTVENDQDIRSESLSYMAKFIRENIEPMKNGFDNFVSDGNHIEYALPTE